MHRSILSSLIAQVEARFVRKLFSSLEGNVTAHVHVFLLVRRFNVNPGSHHVIMHYATVHIRVLIDECDFESLHTERVLHFHLNAM